MSYQTPPNVSSYQRQQIDISAGTAFKVGFFGYFGMLCGALIVGVIFFVIALLAGASLFNMMAS